MCCRGSLRFAPLQSDRQKLEEQLRQAKELVESKDRDMEGLRRDQEQALQAAHESMEV